MPARPAPAEPPLGVWVLLQAHPPARGNLPLSPWGPAAAAQTASFIHTTQLKNEEGNKLKLNLKIGRLCANVCTCVRAQGHCSMLLWKCVVCTKMCMPRDM